MKEKVTEADKIMSELERVNREQLPPAGTVQMKLANGRFQTSRRSCSPDCVAYL